MNRRIIFFNNYPMGEALRLYRDGRYPGQHLWGYPVHDDTAARDWVIPRWSLVAIRLPRQLHRARSAVLRYLGDPLQELYTLVMSRPGDIVYAADQRSAALLGLLKRCGLFRRRMVVVVHHAVTGRWERWCLGRVDAVLYLSDHIGNQLADALPDVDIQEFAPWGPDVDSAIYRQPAEPDSADEYDFMAAGKTNRDYGDLIEGAKRAGLRGVIYDQQGRTTIADGGLRYEKSGPGGTSYPDIVEALRQSACVVVPIKDPAILAGLTEVADAIALDKPIVVSESIAFPYDLNALRAGTSVRHPGPGGYADAIREASRGALGSAGPMQQRFSIERYRAQLDRIFHELNDGSRRRA